MIAKYTKYKNIKKSILDEYQVEDKFFLINDGDKNLIAIRIDLPEMPEPETIDGFGLPAKEQKFTRQKYPPKLKKLEKDCGGSIDLIWERLNKNQRSFRDEIKWIKKQWYHRLFGYWFFNNGKPTYIDGWHFDYLNYFYLDIGLPSYRDRDRRWFLIQRFAYNDTFDFKHKSTEKETSGLALQNERNEYEKVDTGRRVSFGTIGLKGRRFGDTYKAESIGLEMITRAEIPNSIFGIQAMDGDTGKQDFGKIVHSWRKLPFFFQPKFDNSTNPKEEILFNEPGIRSTNNNMVGGDAGLEAKINYASTADRGFYDSTKLLFYLSDEDGKVILECPLTRHQVTKNCLSQGQGAIITGFTIHPTTVGEMADKNINRFKELCDQSNYYIRTENGSTLSGLYVIFFPAYDGLEGFIDEYGVSVIDTPTEQQSEFIQKKIGSRKFLENNLNALLKKGDENSLRTYRENKRLFPLEYADCFLTESGDIGMPYEKIDLRLSELAFDRQATQRGNYERIDKNNPESAVVWNECPDGRWYVSYIPAPEKTNQKYVNHGIWFPKNPDLFTASADPFRLSKVAGSRMSNGGGSVFWERDFNIDPHDKEIKDWITNRFVCTYSYRPATTDEYAEDMLMMCIYWGALMYPEVNLPLIIEYFTKRGYAGFLKYGVDKTTGKYKPTAGFSSLDNSKSELFNLIIDYLQKHCHRERHKEILLEAKKIKGLADMTNYDLFTSAGGCLLGSQSKYGVINMKPKEESYTNISDFFPDYTYS